MKTIVILFGEMGAGKNYHGERLSRMTGFTFFDGDTVISPEMAKKISNFQPLPREMIESYVTHLANEIADRGEDESVRGLIVAQALYMNDDRLYLQYFLRCLGFNVKFYWIKTPFWRNLKQIFSRKNGFRWVFYWLMNKPFFQKPTHKYFVI